MMKTNSVELNMIQDLIEIPKMQNITIKALLNPRSAIYHFDKINRSLDYSDGDENATVLELKQAGWLHNYYLNHFFFGTYEPKIRFYPPYFIAYDGPKKKLDLHVHRYFMQPEEKNYSLNMADMIFRFGKELLFWGACGFPRRSEDLMNFIFNNHCRPCYAFRGTDEGGACRICGCAISKSAGRNKLFMATTHCPKEPIEWF